MASFKITTADKDGHQARFLARSPEQAIQIISDQADGGWRTVKVERAEQAEADAEAARVEAFCACGRILSRCDQSRADCRRP